MFKIHLQSAYRNIVRNKTFSAINMAGLAISLTAFIMMALYIENEWRFDRFHAKASRIYRVADDKQTPDLLIHSAGSAAPVAPALQQEFPEIQEAVRIIGTESLVKYNDKLFEERNIFFADETIFNIFSFPLISGNPVQALINPSSIVISSTTAAKYFGRENPMGKMLLVDSRPMTVTGVLADIPAASHLQFDFLISMATAKQKQSGYDWLFTNWYSTEFYTYILLPEHYPVDRLAERLHDFGLRHKGKDGTVHHYVPEALTSIYLHSKRDNQAGKTGSLSNLYVFSAIAFFILLIAAINFINLSTARAGARAKEVAVKKVAGAGRTQLMTQFLAESFLTTAFSLLLAIVAVYLLLPYFNVFSGKQLQLRIFTGWHAGAAIFLLFSIGLLSGSYPAFVLSGFKPATALKNKVRASGLSTGIRQGLVVFQFTASVVLIVCSMVVYTQINYLQKHALGFTPAQTLVINFEGDRRVQEKAALIKQELLRIPGVLHVTASSNTPGDGKSGGWSMDFARKSGDTVHTELPVYLTDYTYLEQFHIPLLAGRAFSEQYRADSTESMLINETALTKLGFRSPEEAIGVTVGMYPTDGKIIGVFKDFHFESLQKPVEALAMRILPSNFRVFSVELATGNVPSTVAAIGKTWKTLAPDRPLEYSFLDDNFNKQYQAEMKFGQVFAIFTLLAISVACLGLFGLALFSVQQRTKEIGIRKVLGASVAGITGILSRDFIRLVGIAIVLATPVAWYVMSRWLQDFAYRIQVEWWMFAIAGFIAVLVAMLTVSFHAVKAAIANPVKSLRTE